MNKLVVHFEVEVAVDPLTFDCYTTEDRHRILAYVRANRYLPEIKSWFRTAQDGSILEEG